jgi:hypothetical protein
LWATLCIEIVTHSASLRYDVGKILQVHETTAKNGSQLQPAFVGLIGFLCMFQESVTVLVAF